MATTWEGSKLARLSIVALLPFVVSPPAVEGPVCGTAALAAVAAGDMSGRSAFSTVVVPIRTFPRLPPAPSALTVPALPADVAAVLNAGTVE